MLVESVCNRPNSSSLQRHQARKHFVGHQQQCQGAVHSCHIGLTVMDVGVSIVVSKVKYRAQVTQIILTDGDHAHALLAQVADFGTSKQQQERDLTTCVGTIA